MNIQQTRIPGPPYRGQGGRARLQSLLRPASFHHLAFFARSRSFDILPRRGHTQAMTIDVAKDVEEFLQEQVRTGACANPSELVNDVLRSVRDLQSRPFETTPEIEAWLLEAADKPASPLTKADFDAIRERVRARTSSSAS